MKTQHAQTLLALAVLAGTHTQSALALTPGVYFTEALVDPQGSYFFIEITNLTGGPVSLSGWGFDDSTRGLSQIPVCDGDDGDNCSYPFTTTELLNLSAAGSLQNNQSLILTNAYSSVASAYDLGGSVNKAFTRQWGLPETTFFPGTGTTPSSGGNPATIKVIQINDLIRFRPDPSGDELNLYNSSGALVDRLTYGAGFAIDGFSRQASNDDLGNNLANQWDLSKNPAAAPVGPDMFGSYKAVFSADFGNPGFYDANLTAVPEPETYAMMLAGLGLVGLAARRRRATARVYA